MNYITIYSRFLKNNNNNYNLIMTNIEYKIFWSLNFEFNSNFIEIDSDFIEFDNDFNEINSDFIEFDNDFTKFDNDLTEFDNDFNEIDSDFTKFDNDFTKFDNDLTEFDNEFNEIDIDFIDPKILCSILVIKSFFKENGFNLLLFENWSKFGIKYDLILSLLGKQKKNIYINKDIININNTLKKKIISKIDNLKENKSEDLLAVKDDLVKKFLTKEKKKDVTKKKDVIRKKDVTKKKEKILKKIKGKI